MIPCTLPAAPNVRTYGGPDCHDIDIIEEEHHGVPYKSAVFKPDPDELELMNNGGCIVIRMQSEGVFPFFPHVIPDNRDEVDPPYDTDLFQHSGMEALR